MEDKYLMEVCRVDYNYFDLMGMKGVKGENPFREVHDSLHYCLINERAAQLLGMEHPVGAVSYTHLDVYKRQLTICWKT